MARICKSVLVFCLAAALLAATMVCAAEASADVPSLPRRSLLARAWSSAYNGVAQWPGVYGGGWGWGWWPYQENRWVSATRMDTSNERRFAMASKK